jgi:hypothetical protein
VKRVFLGCLTVIPAVACASVVAGTSAAAAATEPPRAALTNPICTQASDSLDRAVAITAVMRPQTGTQRMELQFKLLEMPQGQYTYTQVTGGDLGKWITSPGTLGQRPGDVWKRQKLVVNLAARAVYRFRVGFRWTGAGGRSLGREFVWSGACNQR